MSESVAPKSNGSPRNGPRGRSGGMISMSSSNGIGMESRALRFEQLFEPLRPVVVHPGQVFRNPVGREQQSEQARRWFEVDAIGQTDAGRIDVESLGPHKPAKRPVPLLIDNQRVD